MSIKITRPDGTESLNEREPFLRLYDEGQITPTSTTQDLDGATWYRYNVPIPSDIQGKTIIVFFKSDFDEFFCEAENNEFTLTSRINTLKSYKIYANYSFESYSVPTNYGAKILSPSGNVLYDSRVPEAVYLDHFITTEQGGPYSHNSVSEAWYSVSTFTPFPTFACGPAVGSNLQFRTLIARATLKQVSSTQVESSDFVYNQIIPGCLNSSPTFNLPVMLLDPQYI